LSFVYPTETLDRYAQLHGRNTGDPITDQPQTKKGEQSLAKAQNSGAVNENFFPTTADETIIDNGSKIASFERDLKKIHYNEAVNETSELNDLLSIFGGASQRVVTYPYDLATSPENMDYILFDIYESEGAGIKTVAQKLQRMRAEKSNSTLLNVAGIGAAALVGGDAIAKIGGGLGVAAINQAGTLLNGANQLASGSAKASSDPTIGSGEIGFSQESSGFAQATERVKTSIALYMPPSLQAKYSTKYQDKDFSEMSVLATVGKNVIETVGQVIGGGGPSEGSAKAADAAMQIVGQQAVKVFDKFVVGMIGGEGGAGLQDVINASNRAVPNPQVLQLFQGVDRRTFSFTYEFVPVSEKEALKVYEIIRLFKKYSHPRRAIEGRYLEFPAEFRITFMHGTEENLYIPRIARCVLTGVDLEYGTETFATFQKTNGRNGSPPIKTKMTLNFSEVEILTQERIDQGY